MGDNSSTRFKPGQSGNPNGRKRGLDRLVREAIGDDLPKLFAAQVRIAQGLPPVEVPLMEVKAGDATRAFSELMDRGWHKAKQAIELSGEIAPSSEADWSQVPIEERRAMLELAVKLGAIGVPDDSVTEH